jgi:hypothetical protein
MADVVVLFGNVTDEVFLLPENGQVGEGLGDPLLVVHGGDARQGRCGRRSGFEQVGVYLEEEGMGGRCGLGGGLEQRQERRVGGSRNESESGRRGGERKLKVTYRSHAGQGSLRGTNLFWRGHSARVVEVAVRNILEREIFHAGVVGSAALYLVAVSAAAKRVDNDPRVSGPDVGRAGQHQCARQPSIVVVGAGAVGTTTVRAGRAQQVRALTFSMTKPTAMARRDVTSGEADNDKDEDEEDEAQDTTPADEGKYRRYVFDGRCAGPGRKRQL